MILRDSKLQLQLSLSPVTNLVFVVRPLNSPLDSKPQLAGKGEGGGRAMAAATATKKSETVIIVRVRGQSACDGAAVGEE